MLGDRTRIEAYDKALAHAVRPGAVVADVGAGTLALSALALRHGAGHVYAIEADPQTAAVAAAIAEASGWDDRVTVVHGDARTVRLPREVDVVVAELMGNLGPEEDMARLLRIVARRSLAPGGVVVPRRLVTSLVPVQLHDEGWGVWRDGFLDMRLDVVQQYVRQEAQLHFFTRAPALLGDPVVLADSAARDRGARLARSVTLPLTRTGHLHAVVGYFEAELASGVKLSNFPSYPGCNWAVWVWPLPHAAVRAGDAVRVRVHVPPGERVVDDWRLDCLLARKG